MEQDRYDPVKRYPPGKPLQMISGNASFPLLELILDPTRPPPPLMQDVVLVSIDIESRVIESLGERRITQLGTVSLDTRALTDVDTDNSRSLLNAVQSRVFNVYPKRASPRAWVPTSLWTTPEKIGHGEICAKLDEIFSNLKKNSVAEFDGVSDLGTLAVDRRPRNIILIGHSIHSDRSLLMELFDYDVKRVTSIRAILDTGRMMCSAYDFGIATHSHFSLSMILRCLAIRYDQLHDAGNDAMFSMKALLLMFCNWKVQKNKYLWNVAEELVFHTSCPPQRVSNGTAEDLLWECQLEVLTAIARESWPVPKKLTAPHGPTRPSRRVAIETDLLLLAEDLDLMQTFK